MNIYFKIADNQVVPMPNVWRDEDGTQVAGTHLMPEEWANTREYYLLEESTRPEEKEGFMILEFIKLIENKIKRIFEYQEITPQPPQPLQKRRLSKLAIKTYLSDKKVTEEPNSSCWIAFKNILIANDVYEDFIMADYIEEGNAQFESILPILTPLFQKYSIDYNEFVVCCDDVGYQIFNLR